MEDIKWHIIKDMEGNTALKWHNKTPTHLANTKVTNSKHKWTWVDLIKEASKTKDSDSNSNTNNTAHNNMDNKTIWDSNSSNTVNNKTTWVALEQTSNSNNSKALIIINNNSNQHQIKTKVRLLICFECLWFKNEENRN